MCSAASIAALQERVPGPSLSHNHLEDCLPLSSKVEFKLLSDQKSHFYLRPKEICHVCTYDMKRKKHIFFLFNVYSSSACKRQKLETTRCPETED